jgi:hypothetical protein
MTISKGHYKILWLFKGRQFRRRCQIDRRQRQREWEWVVNGTDKLVRLDRAAMRIQRILKPEAASSGHSQIRADRDPSRPGLTA